MKLADMFGSGLPVCAYDYGPCLSEQLRHGENGLLFSSGEQLADQLFELFEDFGKENSLLSRLQRNVREADTPRWENGWKQNALPMFVRQ